MSNEKTVEVPVFTAQVRKSGGSLEITMDSRVTRYEGIEEGDYVKVFVVKLPKKKDC